MTDSTWDDAEEVGIEMLARCCALHVYARKEEDYILNLTARICRRADEWAHEGNNPFVLACASVGHRMEIEAIQRKERERVKNGDATESV